MDQHSTCAKYCKYAKQNGPVLSDIVPGLEVWFWHCI